MLLGSAPFLVQLGLGENLAGRFELLRVPHWSYAEMKRAFGLELACLYSGQVLSYQKMLGQLTDAGNTTTLAHYLDLLDAAGMVTGLQKYAGRAVRRRGSSPKLQVLNTALLTAQSELGLEELRRDGETWGRLVESAVGGATSPARPP